MLQYGAYPLQFPTWRVFTSLARLKRNIARVRKVYDCSRAILRFSDVGNKKKQLWVNQESAESLIARSKKTIEEGHELANDWRRVMEEFDQRLKDFRARHNPQQPDRS